MNKAFRTEDIELLYTFRFFIIDLCTAIEEENRKMKDKCTLTVYRGTQMPAEELEKLKDSVGKIISTNGFLSTSRNINVAYYWTHADFIPNKFVSVLFEIIADPSLKSAVFCDIGDESNMEDKKEVLFSLSSLFQITSINFDSKVDIWRVQLNTIDESAEKLEKYFNLSKQVMKDSAPTIYVGYLLMTELGQMDRAGKYFNMLLKSFPSDHPDLGSVYTNIGNIHKNKNEINLALKNYQKAYEIRQKHLPSDHPLIAGSLHNIASVYKDKGELDLALDYYHQALRIDDKAQLDNNLNKALTIECIGRVYVDKDDLDAALDHFVRALEIYKHVLPDQNQDTAQCLGMIGCVHEKRKHLDVALDYYHQQLKMEEQCLPSDHVNLSDHLDWIVNIYKQMNEFEKALDFCREKLSIQKSRLSDNHPRIAQMVMIMAGILKDKGLKPALECYREALSILDNSKIPDHQITSNCLISMACLYSEYDMNEDALQCEFKALELNRHVLPSDHIDIANNLKNIGISYMNMNNPSEALRYFNESLSIYRLNYRLDNDKIKLLEEDIARLNGEL